MARPLNPSNGRYDLRAEPSELERWAEAAEQDGRSLAQWVVRALNRAAAAQLRGKIAAEKKDQKSTSGG